MNGLSTPRLDCETPLGLHMIARQKELIAAAERRWHVSIIETDDPAASYDAVIYRDGVLVGVLEVRSRNTSWAQIRSWQSYLITAEKLNKGLQASAQWSVPYILLIGCYPARVARWWKLTGREHIDMKATTTRATCNGGSACRMNAFLPYGWSCPLSHSPFPLDRRRDV